MKPSASLRPGFLMLDVLLGLSIFALFVTATGFSLLVGQRGVLNSGDRVRATLLSERALEVARSIRDRDIDELTDGTHGTTLSGGTWQLQGSGTTTEDGFHTTLQITHEDDRIALVARTQWNMAQTRSGSVTLRSELTDWRVVQAIGDWGNVTFQGSYVDSGTPLFNDAVVYGDYAFVTSETSAGGAGLYVFDLADLATPTRVATSFSLGAAGYEILVNAGRLFVVTDDAANEIAVYDLTDPAALDADDRVATINVPGLGRARSIAFFNGTLYVTAVESSTEAELYSYDIADIGAITLQDSLQDGGSHMDLALHEGYVYIASTQDDSELRVGDIFDPTDVILTEGSGYNLTDVQDGQAMATFGTSALLGRANGSAIAELVLFAIDASPIPSPPPGPWSQEIGGSINGIDVEPGGRYAFIATENTTKELQVIDIPSFRGGAAPEADAYDTATGNGRGVLYDYTRDRAYLMTNKAFLVLQPGT